jgi:hypothetical protein
MSPDSSLAGGKIGRAKKLKLKGKAKAEQKKEEVAGADEE